MSNGRAERMAGTIKKGIKQAVLRSDALWLTFVNQVVYGYRRRKPSGQQSPFFLMYGVHHRLCVADPKPLLHDPANLANRCYETIAVQSHRAAKGASSSKRLPTNNNVFHYNVGDMVWVAKGRAIGPMKMRAFQSPWYRPCKVVSAKHPRYELITSNGKVSREAIHACWSMACCLRPVRGNHN